MPRIEILTACGSAVKPQMVDNHGTIELATGPKHNDRNIGYLGIDIRHHFSRCKANVNT